MKKITALLLSLCLLSFSAACSVEEPVPSTTQATNPIESTTAPTTAAPTQDTQPAQTYHAPLLAFSSPVITREFYGDTGNKAVVFSYLCQNFSLVLEDPQISEIVTLDLLNRVDYENSPAKKILSDAQSAYSGQSDWIPYSFSTVFSPQRFDRNILSLYGNQAVSNGSPRPTLINHSVTYDLLSGRALNLKDILIADFSADTLSELITEALSAPANEGILYSDYAYVVSELFTTNKPTDNWFLSNAGLCFYFAPYEIAPYSAGTLIAEVPYQDLIGLLKDEYFPLETITLPGGIVCEAFDDADLDNFTQFPELIMDDNGNEYLLYTDGCLQNVRIETGTWLSDSSFLPNATVFAAVTLCSTDALLLQLDSKDSQGLRLSYISNGEPVIHNLADLLP